MKTTLNKIKKQSHSDGGLNKLLTYLNKTEADDEDLSLLTILESNGLDYAIWSLEAVEGFEKEKRLMACDFAESVVRLASDERSVTAIKVSRNYANGLATIEELNAAFDASWDAVGLISDIAGRAAHHAARAANVAAHGVASYAAAGAYKIAWYAAAAADAVNQKKQIAIFKKYVKQKKY